MGNSPWLLLVDHDFHWQAWLGSVFVVVTEDKDVIRHLKEKVIERLRRRLQLPAGTDYADISVWRVKPVEGETVLKESELLTEDIPKLDKVSIDSCVPVAELQAGLSENEILLVQMPAPRPERPITNIDEVSASKDDVPELIEFKAFERMKERYEQTVRTLGPSPSQGAKSTGYCGIQSNNAQVIFDGRWARNINTTAPPIQIFHPVFHDFIRLVDDPDVQPTAQDLKMVYDLMHSASEVGQVEECYSARLSMPDGVVTLDIMGTQLAYLFLELKREIGEGDCDPSTQVALSMRRAWIHDSRKIIREKCCCPTFLIAAGGPWFSVLGSVFTDRFIVQRLTDMRWMALSSTEEDNRVYHNARTFVALRESLAKLQTFYSAFQADPSPHPVVSGGPHSRRFFPYPTSFTTEHGSTTHFEYRTTLEDDSACVTYLADVVGETGMPMEKLVVKFVTRYSPEVHEFPANKGYAPTLRYFGSFTPELDGVSLPRPTQCAPPGLHLRSDIMNMVVMEYISASPNSQLGDMHKQQIKTVLNLLHSSGYVFGDLRMQNIRLGADGNIRLIDFDWCGRYNMEVEIPSGILPDDLWKQIDKNKVRHRLTGGGPYAYYPLSISTVENMWADGMVALAEIRPEHDWLMLDKLL